MRREVKLEFIPEIQGLRTVALLMVATFHVWFDKVSGGVDVFLLVSAYLMTRSLVARSERGSITRPFSFLVHKFSRLLPAAVSALLLILAGVFLVLPPSRWNESVGESVASLFYVENIRLQNALVDYFNTNQIDASPFQHFWSLSVQGQIFIAFVLIHLFGDLVARALKLSPRKVLLVLFIVAASSSFAYSVWLTSQDQAFAYFDTGARAWEFAVGSILALVHPWIRAATWFRVVASWAGICAMLACGFVLPVESSFPGWAALWPVGAAALVIISTGPPTKYGADRILATGVLNSLGSYTYALYLTHWPVLILFLFAMDLERLNWWQGAVVLGISFVLSFVIARLVEQPIARWTKAELPPKKLWMPRFGWRSPITIALSAALVLVGAGAGAHAVEQQRSADLDFVEGTVIADVGANAIGNPDATPAPVPAETVASNDWVFAGAECAQDDPYISARCYEIPAETKQPEKTVLTVGSSHTAQLNGALLEAVNRNPGWEFRTQFTPFCYFSNRVDIGEECVVMWDQVAAYIVDEQPDLVVLPATRTDFDSEPAEPELVEWMKALSAASPSTQFVAMRDTPRNPSSLFECAVQNGFESDECVYWYSTSPDPDYIGEIESIGAIWVDINDYICPDNICRPVEGGVVTYFDESHLTGTYMRTLAQKFTDAITDQVEWWPQNVYAEGTPVDRAQRAVNTKPFWWPL
ncbi:acyltransferase family protein [Leucobacter sp. gxy201]|uniref:acyltransferase family protein n=1 Tax=Leucobacter sp. gxy201 TaxID=2957200 RepID=UPI003D9FB949